MDLIERLEALLMARLAEKTSWGRNEVKVLFLECKATAATQLLMESKDGRN